jgi:hypothetical protein
MDDRNSSCNFLRIEILAITNHSGTTTPRVCLGVFRIKYFWSAALVSRYRGIEATMLFKRWDYLDVECHGTLCYALISLCEKGSILKWRIGYWVRRMEQLYGPKSRVARRIAAVTLTVVYERDDNVISVYIKWS